jgi:osmoprotectant transport system ATP-binding protein
MNLRIYDVHVIELLRVSKTYPNGAVAVRDVSFTVATGTITCLIGASGCGKTTTLRMINRLVEPTSGEIRVDGRKVSERDPIELRRTIGYVVQDGGLLPHMTAGENVALLETVKGTKPAAREKRVRELLDLVGLEPDTYARRYPAELSGGQRQRVAIARALVADPPLLLMDEPFAALDPLLRAQLQEELARLQRALARTVVLVTHDLLEAFRLATRIVLMRDGCVVQEGTREDFLERPADSFVREFVGAQTRGLA